MEQHELPFAKLNKLHDSLVETIVHEGVEMTPRMVDQYHKWLLTNLTPPFGILVNKINQYTYTFEAQLQLADLPEIKAMAVISYSTITELSTKTMEKMPRKNKWNMKMFRKREDALLWLEDELKKDDDPSPLVL